MNDVLTSYSGGLLYGSEYRCIDEKVARRRLRMRRLPEDDLLRACLDPAHPLVMVLLDGELPSRESEREARVVAGLVKWMRLEMLDETGGPFESDEEFFTRGLFIISPHHSQIRLIRGELRRNHDWSYPPFVDTVEKMQGQESHAVIISYGVSDPEYAMQEAEFIYGVNRLNVAITRAQAKSIFLISRALLEGSPGVWELPQSAKGLAYLVRLTQALRGSTPPLRIALKDGVSAEVLRASSVWDWAADGPALAARA